jgi:hypothetical protein
MLTPRKTKVAGFTEYEWQYDTGGHPVDGSVETEAIYYFSEVPEGSAIENIIVISHGWNNDIADARDLYLRIFNCLGAELDARGQRRDLSYGVIGVFWPSKKFTDAALIPGGAAGLGDPMDAVLNAQLNDFAALFADNPSTPATIAHLRTLIPILAFSTSAQDDYVAGLDSLVPKSRYEPDEGLDNARGYLSTMRGSDVLRNLMTPMGQTTMTDDQFTPGAGGAQSLGSTVSHGFGNLLGSIKGAAQSVGDLFTYYTMKDRSGIVGRTGLASALTNLIAARAQQGVTSRIHLVGHSFGARLVTSAANEMATPVESLSLLQAAFSHNAFSDNYDQHGSAGGFRAVVTTPKVKRMLITHSKYDQAVGLAYPAASRIMNQVASAIIGGPNDIYGGLGRNGAQKTPEVETDTLPCSIINLNGDGPNPEITGHGDVAKSEIARAMLAYTIG